MGHARDVPAGPGKTGDKPAEHGVSHGSKDDRDRAGRLLGRQRRRRTPRHNDVDLESDQFGDERREALIAALRGAVFQGETLALHIAQLAQPVAEDLREQRSGGTNKGDEHTDAGDFPRPLAADGE